MSDTSNKTLNLLWVILVLFILTLGLLYMHNEESSNGITKADRDPQEDHPTNYDWSIRVASTPMTLSGSPERTGTRRPYLSIRGRSNKGSPGSKPP